MDEYTKISEGIGKLQSDIVNDLLALGHVAGILIGIVGFTLLIIEVNTIRKIKSIDNWPVIKDGGLIRSSYMESASGSTTYSIFVISNSRYSLYYRTRVSFTYEINGKTYVSNKISYYEPWQSNPIVAKIESETFTTGSHVDIRVNPDNPEEAYIYNKQYDTHLRLFIGIILSCLALYLIYKL